MFRSWLVLIVVFLAGSWAQGQDTWQYPLDVAIGRDGSYFIADRKLPGLWKYADGQNTILYQGKKTYRTPLNAVRCVHVGDDGVLYVGDSATREVYSVSEKGVATPLTNGTIGIPTAISVVAGTVYVTDLELQRVWKFPSAGTTDMPIEFAAINGPRGLFVDDKGFIWVLSALQPQLRKYTGEGKFEPVLNELVFEFPHQLVVAKDGTVYVTDGYAKAIWKITPGGKPEKWVSGEPFMNPVGLRQQGDNLIVCDPRANALFQVTLDGKVSKIFGGPPNPLPSATIELKTPIEGPAESKPKDSPK